MPNMFCQTSFRGTAYIFDNFVSMGILAEEDINRNIFAKIIMLQNVRTAHAFTKSVTFLKLGALIDVLLTSGSQQGHALCNVSSHSE